MRLRMRSRGFRFFQVIAVLDVDLLTGFIELFSSLIHPGIQGFWDGCIRQR